MDVRLQREIARWHTAGVDPPLDGLELGRQVTREVRRRGRHFVDPALLAALDDVARSHRGRDPYLDAFLDAVLARQHDRFRNETYLALPLLELIVADPATGLDPDGLATLLMADVVAHEGAPDADVDARTAATRARHAARFVAATGPSRIAEAPPTRAAAWLPLTVLPVSLEHDEYFFVRALQAHEQTFLRLTTEMRAATGQLRRGWVPEATASLRRANHVVERAALLFRVVATLRPESFHSFRRYTDGASAIQSAAYKRFELACGSPDEERLRSEAFTNVPTVRAEAPAPDDLARAFGDLRRGGRTDPQVQRALQAEIDRLEAAHQRWKTTHHSLAARMLGDAPGSGYTAGVPYLRGCLSNRLFTASDGAAPTGPATCAAIAA